MGDQGYSHEERDDGSLLSSPSSSNSPQPASPLVVHSPAPTREANSTSSPLHSIQSTSPSTSPFVASSPVDSATELGESFTDPLSPSHAGEPETAELPRTHSSASLPCASKCPSGGSACVALARSPASFTIPVPAETFSPSALCGIASPTAAQALMTATTVIKAVRRFRLGLSPLHLKAHLGSCESRTSLMNLDLDENQLSPTSKRLWEVRQRVQKLCPVLDTKPLVIVMVGLPGCGKSYVSQRMTRYLGWRGVVAKVFNAGNYRRKVLGSTQGADFFDPENPIGSKLREEMAILAMDDLVTFIRSRGQVGILDATNTTRDRRQKVLTYLQHELGLPYNRVLFFESVCDDSVIIRHTVKEIKLKNEDYQGKVDLEAAFDDFMDRRRMYEKAYQPLTREHDKDLSWIQSVNVGSYLQVNNVKNELTRMLLRFSMALPTSPAPLFIASADITTSTPCSVPGLAPHVMFGRGLLPGDPIFARRLSVLMRQLRGRPEFAPWAHEEWGVWTSTMHSAHDSVKKLSGMKGFDVIHWNVLDEINFGTWTGKTWDEIQLMDPEGANKLRDDRFFFCFPCGESLLHLVQRLHSVILALETAKRPTLIVAHEHVCWCLLAYCLARLPEECVHMHMPPYGVLRLTLAARAKDSQLSLYDLSKEPPVARIRQPLPTNQEQSSENVPRQHSDGTSSTGERTSSDSFPAPDPGEFDGEYHSRSIDIDWTTYSFRDRNSRRRASVGGPAAAAAASAADRHEHAT